MGSHSGFLEKHSLTNNIFKGHHKTDLVQSVVQIRRGNRDN